MRNTILFLVVSSLSSYLHGQNKHLLENYDFDSTYKIIAVGAYTDKNKIPHKELTFYVYQQNDLNKIKSTLSYGNRINNPTIDEDDLGIYIIKGKEILEDAFYVNPTYSNINIDGKYFEFDPAQLKTLSRQHPINYSIQLLKFKNDAELALYLKKNIPDPRFLCYEDVSEGMDGKCSITLEIEIEEKPVQKGWDIIEADLKKIGAKKTDDYIISYSPSIDPPNMYKYNIWLSKKLYDKLNNKAYTKSTWTMNMKEIFAYWKK